MNKEGHFWTDWLGHASLQDAKEEEIDSLLQRFPYSVHLQWIKAKNTATGQNDYTAWGSYVSHPLRFQRFLEEKEPVKENKKPLLPIETKEVLPFQPLYTEDYFAYTKTKLPEKIEDDKPPTMEQVRSFTGWLKMMKRPAAEELILREEEETGNGTVAVEDVQPVYTESMAQIWEENNQPAKAIAIYEKLILLNPEKKGYFAAKIRVLKGQE